MSTREQLALSPEMQPRTAPAREFPAPREPEPEPERPADAWRVSGRPVRVRELEEERER